MSRKREKPYHSRHIPYSYPKRRRPIPRAAPVVEAPKEKATPPPAVVVSGLPKGCSVLDLKSRFEIYGPISRIRIDSQGLGFISFRSQSGADSALSASVDPSFGISIDSHPVQVKWASEMREEAAGIGEERESKRSPNSKLLRGETPLSRHGRGNRLSSAIVNPNNTTTTTAAAAAVLDAPFKPTREIIAYDDLF